MSCIWVRGGGSGGVGVSGGGSGGGNGGGGNPGGHCDEGLKWGEVAPALPRR